jgi:hypothetical protein
MNEGRINSTPDDEIYTPAYAVKVLLPHLKPNSKILCPFDMAHSEYVKVLSNAGHLVYYPHLELGGGVIPRDIVFADIDKTPMGENEYPQCPFTWDKENEQWIM